MRNIFGDLPVGAQPEQTAPPPLDVSGITKGILDRYKNGDFSEQQVAAFDELKARGELDKYLPSQTVNMFGDVPIDEEKVVEEGEQDFIRPMTWKNVMSGAVSNTPKSAGQFIKDLVTPLLHPVDTAKALGALGEGIYQKFIPGTQDDEQIVDDLMEAFKERYGGIENLKKTIAEDPVGAVADIATFLVPAGAAVKGVGAATKVKTVAQVGRKISKAGQLLEPVSVAGKVVKKVAQKVIPKELPGRLYRSAAKFSTTIPVDVRKALSDTALSNRIMPTMKGLDDLRGKINVINDEITGMIDVATKKGTKIPTKALFTKLKKLRKETVLSGEPLTNKRAIDNIAKQISRANKKTLSPQDVQKLKQNIYKETESLYSKATQKPIRGTTKQAIAKSAKESLEKLFPEIKQLNRNEGSLLALKKEIEKAASRIANRDVIGIGVPIKGGAGGALAGPGGLVAGVTLGLLDTPGVKSKLAIVLDSLRRKGVVLADDSLFKQFLDIAPGGGAVAARQAGILTEETE